MKPITIMRDTQTAKREDWLAARRKFIGASEAAAVINNDHGRRLAVWLDKRGELPPQPFDEDTEERMAWGLRLEDVIAKSFEDKTGLRTRRTNRMIAHPKTPYIGCNIDRRIVPSDDNDLGILEIKTTSQHMFREEWKVCDDGTVIPPDRYLLQVAQQQYVADIDMAYVAVLVGGQRMFISKPLHRDQAVENTIIEEETRFWESVQQGTPPLDSIDGSLAMERLLKSMFPTGTGNVVLSDEEAALVREVHNARKVKRDAEKVAREYENKLKYALGSFETAVVDNLMAQWKDEGAGTEVDMAAMEADYPEEVKCFKDAKAAIDELSRGYEKKKKRRVLRIKEIVDHEEEEGQA